MIRVLVSLIVLPLLSGCAYLQYVGLFPSTGTVEDSPSEKTIVTGVMVNQDGTPLSGIVMLEEGKLFRGKFRRGGIVDSSGRFAVELPGGGEWRLHGYADGYIYHPEAIVVEPRKINRYRWVLAADKNPLDNPVIRGIALTPNPAPGVTVTITLDAFDHQLRLSQQILAFNARTGDALVMEPPEQPRWGRPLEGKLSIPTGSTAQRTARCRPAVMSMTGSSSWRTRTAASQGSRGRRSTRLVAPSRRGSLSRDRPDGWHPSNGGLAPSRCQSEETDLYKSTMDAREPL